MDVVKRLNDIKKKMVDEINVILKHIDELDNQKPEFEVGDWIIPELGIYKSIPRRINKIDCGLNMMFGDEDKYFALNSTYRHATEAEIKAQLIKKYHNDYPDNRFECLDGWTKKSSSKWTNNEPVFRYYKDDDELIVYKLNIYGLCVYMKGKWAERIVLSDDNVEKSEFRAGDWIISNTPYHKNIPRRIKGYDSADNIICDDKHRINIICHRHALEAEIKAQLIEKYRKDYPDNKFKELMGWISETISPEDWGSLNFRYEKDTDKLWVWNKKCFDLLVYRQGEWAKPIKPIRDDGYYWVKFDVENHDPVGENGWEIAYYKEKEGWCGVWGGVAWNMYDDDELEEINETKLVYC